MELLDTNNGNPAPSSKKVVLVVQICTNLKQIFCQDYGFWPKDLIAIEIVRICSKETTCVGDGVGFPMLCSDCSVDWRTEMLSILHAMENIRCLLTVEMSQVL